MNNLNIPHNICNKKGSTLVEVIASFVILVILLVSFFTLFIQTKQTTKSSETIVDATYVAQTEMENFYSISKKYTFNHKEDGITDLHYQNASCANTYFKEDAQYPGYTIALQLAQNAQFPSNLSDMTITVYDKKTLENPDAVCSNPQNYKAIMQNVIEWKAGL